MKPVAEPWEARPPCRLVIWHTEGTAISGLLSWMWRLKKSLPAVGVKLTLVSLEIQPFRFPQVCDAKDIYDVRLRTPQELIAFLKTNRSAVHIINHAYEYVDLLEKIAPTLLPRLTLVGICHTDQDYYYNNIARLDPRLSGIIAVSPRCVEKLEEMLPHRRGQIPVLPDWDMPIPAAPQARQQNVLKPLNVLFNGRILHLQKRVLDLPVITRRLAEMKANVQLTIIGDGPDLPRLREELGQGTRIPVRLLMPCAPWEMGKNLEEHEVFLQISEFEGASVSLMEAMVAGLAPVVTHTESGTDLLNRRNAVLCPIGNNAAIADALSDLAQDRAKIPALGQEAFQSALHYLQELGYTRRLRDYLEGFQSVLPAAAF